MLDSAKKFLTTSLLGRMIMLGPRIIQAVNTAKIVKKIIDCCVWVVRSKEFNNWTYNTTSDNKHVLCNMISMITGESVATILDYLKELEGDEELRNIIKTRNGDPELRWQSDPDLRPGRRISYYLLVRAMKPEVVMEAGLDKGYGSLLIARALKLNEAEGITGKYYGIEFDPRKTIPFFVRDIYEHAKVVRGDSVEFIEQYQGQIDLFIHDTVPDDVHMARQLNGVLPKLNERGVILSVWTTKFLLSYARLNELYLLTHQDETVDHPHPGSRLAFVFKKSASLPIVNRSYSNQKS